MPSFGEADGYVSSRNVIKVRAQNIYAGQAIYPRLCISLLLTLNEVAPRSLPPDDGLQGYWLQTLAGELRLAEHGSVLGPLRINGSPRNVRSLPFSQEHSVELVCDLDWARFEAIEEYRAGREAVFWLTLWPTISGASGALDSEIRDLKLDVPRDRWLEYLDQVTGIKRAVLEVLVPGRAIPSFSTAADHLADAQRRINLGDYDGSVATCRKAIESAISALSLPKTPTTVRSAFESATDTRRAEQYAGLTSRIKELCSIAVHPSDASVVFTRAEARFITSTAAHLITLMGTLLSHHDGDA